MKWAVVLTDAAERDVNSGALWYEREAAGLGRQFLDAVGVALEHIASNPQQFPFVCREQRRALLKRFPYALYFRVQTRSVVVVGCFTATAIREHGNRGASAPGSGPRPMRLSTHNPQLQSLRVERSGARSLVSNRAAAAGFER